MISRVFCRKLRDLKDHNLTDRKDSFTFDIVYRCTANPLSSTEVRYFEVQ